MKIPRQNLRIPGPTPIPQEVEEALSQPMINHRGPIFKELIYSATERLKSVFMTQNDLYILTASGTGALEASVVNTLSPGDPVLAVSVGSFGDRFAGIAQAYGAQVIKLDFEWGTAADPQEIRAALQKNPAIKAVLVTHNETSTGVTNALEAISKVVKDEFDKLLLVDAISSLGCLPLPVDEWRCDMVATSSQKGFMVPPGLAFISVSPRAWEAYKQARMPRFYFDLPTAQRYLERGQTPWTPNLTIFYALDVALDRLLVEGMENVFQRHARIARMVREGVKALGLSLLVKDEKAAADTVTAVKVPEGVDGKELVAMMRTEHDIVLGGGQGKLEGKIFRIGHMGYVKEEEIRQVLEALKRALPRLGFQPAKASTG